MAGSCDALVLFGATGDLAKRKVLPALYDLRAAGRGRVPTIGVARSQWDDDDLRDYARAALDEFGPDDLDPAHVDGLLADLAFLEGDYGRRTPSPSSPRASATRSDRCCTSRSRPACSPR